MCFFYSRRVFWEPWGVVAAPANMLSEIKSTWKPKTTRCVRTKVKDIIIYPFIHTLAFLRSYSSINKQGWSQLLRARTETIIITVYSFQWVKHVRVWRGKKSAVLYFWSHHHHHHHLKKMICICIMVKEKGENNMLKA